MKVKSESESAVTQSCPTLRDPMDCSPPGSSVHGIFQARVLEWGAIAFSKVSPYLGINLNKEVKDLNIENYKALIKETEDKNKWKEILCSWNRRINIAKMSSFPRQSCRFNVTRINIPTLFTEIE